MNIWPIRRARTLTFRQPSKETRAEDKRRAAYTNEQLIEQFDTFLLVSGKAERTRLAYKEALRQFDRFLKGQGLTTVKTLDVRAFFGHLRLRNMQPGTIAARRFALKVFYYRYLEFDRRLDFAVPRVAATLKPPPSKTETEIERLIAAADNPRDRSIIEVGYASGLRVAELANLRVEDLSLEAESLTARQGKGGNDRVAYVGTKAVRALREYLDGRTTGFVFQPRSRTGTISVWRDRWGTWRGAWRERTADGKVIVRTVRLGDYELPTRKLAREALEAFLAGKPDVGFGRATYKEIPDAKCRLSTRQLFRIVVAIAKRAGIEGVHPHVLRHSVATHCVKRGMDILSLQQILGHASPVTTQKYVHLDFADLKRIHTKCHPHAGVGTLTRKRGA